MGGACVFRAVGILAVLGAPAVAQDHEVETYGAILTACYAAGEGLDAKAACEGRMAEACMTREEGGQTTVGMSLCTYAEGLVWDRFLNEEYRQTMAWAKAADEDERHHFPEFAKREESLLAAQRAWIAFRDAECGLAYAVWGSGSMRQIAGSSCMTAMTAERTLELLSIRRGME